MAQIGKPLKIGVAVPEKEPVPIKRDAPVKPEPTKTPERVPA